MINLLDRSWNYATQYYWKQLYPNFTLDECKSKYVEYYEKQPIVISQNIEKYYDQIRSELAYQTLSTVAANNLLSNNFTAATVLEYLKVTNNSNIMSAISLKWNRRYYYESLDYMLTDFNSKCLVQANQHYDTYQLNFGFAQQTEQLLDFLKLCMLSSSVEVYAYGEFSIGRQLEFGKSVDYRFPVRLNITMLQLSSNCFLATGGCLNLLFHRNHYTQKFQTIESRFQ